MIIKLWRWVRRSTNWRQTRAIYFHHLLKMRNYSLTHLDANYIIRKLRITSLPCQLFPCLLLIQVQHYHLSYHLFLHSKSFHKRTCYKILKLRKHAFFMKNSLYTSTQFGQCSQTLLLHFSDLNFSLKVYLCALKFLFKYVNYRF